MKNAVTLRDFIRDIPDFPKPGILFKDITPLLNDAEAFSETTRLLVEPYLGGRVEMVAGVEARGFMLAAPLALHLRAGFIPIRKPGKLPARSLRESYDLEYGKDALEIHADAIVPGQRVLLVDDLLATGGTSAAAVRLIEHLGGVVVGLAFVIELAFLGGRARLPDRDITSLITY